MTPEDKSVSLTAQQRAEKIMRAAWDGVPKGISMEEGWKLFRSILTERLAKEIREAVEDARQDGTFRGGYHLGDLQKAYKQGKAEAYEKAAKIAEGTPDGCMDDVTPGQWIADQIRARAKEA